MRITFDLVNSCFSVHKSVDSILSDYHLQVPMTNFWKRLAANGKVVLYTRVTTYSFIFFTISLSPQSVAIFSFFSINCSIYDFIYRFFPLFLPTNALNEQDGKLPLRGWLSLIMTLSLSVSGELCWYLFRYLPHLICIKGIILCILYEKLLFSFFFSLKSLFFYFIFPCVYLSLWK